MVSVQRSCACSDQVFLGRESQRNIWHQNNRKWESPPFHWALSLGPCCFSLKKLKMEFSPGAPSSGSPAFDQLLTHAGYTHRSVHIHCPSPQLRVPLLLAFPYPLILFLVCNFEFSLLLLPEPAFNLAEWPARVTWAVLWHPGHCVVSVWTAKLLTFRESWRLIFLSLESFILPVGFFFFSFYTEYEIFLQDHRCYTIRECSINYILVLQGW